ncbi:hypothetical protein LJ739_12060 [Aestuariibacter halophilus]|uniref:STAS/SEC14 domain-containing protein n=1 Tax=Fluctibacter halophilus TaxID=226011 RepID=A0ABS8G8S4_9ALTE|nr:hypothetical protein [Aestuariibacter halophilus]MCC2616977.1 hypothetical protein [Aestuariibacter halophilus]
MRTKFAMHGTLSVRIDGQVLILEGQGPWNTEALQIEDERIMTQVKGLYGQPWGVLGLFRGEAVYVPEAAKALVENVREEKHQGRIATAIVIEASPSAQFSQLHLKDLYQQASENVSFFSTEADAMAWLQRQLQVAGKG